MTASAAPTTTLPSISAQRKRKAVTERLRDPRGDRYDHRACFDPRTSLSAPRLRRDSLACAAVPDPLDAGKRVLANVNRRVDLLEDERSHGRISVSQYEVGRQVQAVFEKASGARSGSGVWGMMAGREVPKDTHGLSSQEVCAIRAITDARELKILAARIERSVGPYGVRLLRELLCGAGSFKDHARARNALAGERECTQLAIRFRFLLEALDETLSARGLVQFDRDGNPVIRAERGELTGEETDERGRVVPAGHGYRWGRVSPAGNETD